MSYLVHHGYCSTAEAFAKTCGQIVAEDLVSMQNRQSKLLFDYYLLILLVLFPNSELVVIRSFDIIIPEIQRLILEGHIPDAEEETKNLYPNLLDSNPDLLFMLRCRHFVELVGKSMTRKSKVVEETSSDSLLHQNNSCNGDARSKESQHDKRGTQDGSEEMEITYSNGYQNGCGDEMGIPI